MGLCYSKKDDCPICLGPIYINHYNTPCCNTSFHKQCYMKWYNEHYTCPCCRFSHIVDVDKLSPVQVFIIQRLQEFEQQNTIEHAFIIQPSILALDTQH